MHIHPDVPALQLDPDQRLLSVFVVLGPGHCDTKGGNRAGVIKTVRFGPHTTSPLLGEVDWIKEGARKVGVRSICLSITEQRAGTRFLKDLYEDEGRLDIYKAYASREQAIHRHQPVGPMSEAYLPAKVREWRALVSSNGPAFEMPPLELSTPATAASAPVMPPLETSTPAIAASAPVRRRATADAPPSGSGES